MLSLICYLNSNKKNNQKQITTQRKATRRIGKNIFAQLFIIFSTVCAECIMLSNSTYRYIYIYAKISREEKKRKNYIIYENNILLKIGRSIRSCFHCFNQSSIFKINVFLWFRTISLSRRKDTEWLRYLAI